MSEHAVPEAWLEERRGFAPVCRRVGDRVMGKARHPKQVLLVLVVFGASVAVWWLLREGGPRLPTLDSGGPAGGGGAPLDVERLDVDALPARRPAGHVGMKGVVTSPPGGESPSDGPARTLPVAHGPVRIEVVSLHGLALAHTRVRVEPASGPPQVVRTDADGKATLERQPYDGSTVLRAVDVSPLSGPPHGNEAPSWAVLGPAVRMEVSTGWPVRMRAVDAATGLVVQDVRWRVHVHGDPEQPFVTAGTGSASTFARPGGPCVVALEVEAPSRYVAWEPAIFEQHVAHGATSLLVVYPLQREVRVVPRTERGLEPEVLEAKLSRVRIGDEESALVPLQRSRRELSLVGVPYFRDTEFVARLAGDAPREDVARHPVVAEVTGRMPAQFDTEVPGEAKRIVHGGGVDPRSTAQARTAGLARTWRVREARLAPRGFGSRPSRQHPDASSASGTLRIVRLDGQPAAGAQFWMAGVRWQADPEGVYEFVLQAGPVRLRLLEPGLVPTSLDTSVALGTGNEIVLAEPQGGALDVHVVDESGSPLPFARVRVRSLTVDFGPTRWGDRDASVQRVDHFTDHEGRYLAEAVEPGRLRVDVSWADRSAAAGADVAPGKTTKVELTLAALPRRPRVR
ncbi:MAG: hypothetical protein AB7T63_07405 [Planctomycetota bacterium]